MNDTASPARGKIADVRQRSLAAGVVARAWRRASWARSFDPAQFLRAYLTAYLFYLGIGLGAMVLLMVYLMTGGSWGYVIRRILEAGMKTLPLLALLFLPIAFGLRYLYPSARPEAVAASPQLQYQQFYLGPNYFWMRAAAYFALWLLFAFLLGSWLGKAERAEGSHWPRRLRTLGGIGALIYGITLHFAAVDWAMSLTPSFHSTIWGPLFALGQLLSALLFALVVFAMLVPRPPLSEVVSPKVLNDLGSLLLTLLILWAYLAWFQYMLIWIANLRGSRLVSRPNGRILADGHLGDRAAAFCRSVFPAALAGREAQRRHAGGRGRLDPVHAVRVPVLPGHAEFPRPGDFRTLDGSAHAAGDWRHLARVFPAAIGKPGVAAGARFQPCGRPATAAAGRGRSGAGGGVGL